MNYAPTIWERVSKRNPCPICERPDWCGVSADETVARCMRVQSDQPSESTDGEMGWIHKLSEPVEVRREPARQAAKPTTEIDWERLLCSWRAGTLPGQYRELATGLGVSVRSLERLGACYASEHYAWAFPMYSARRVVTGVRLRNVEGRKWAVTGTKQGIFWPDMLTGEGPMLIVEGPTDTAAVLGWGYDTIGRPSCLGGVTIMLNVLVEGYSRDVVILSDRDEAKSRPDGSTWYPGQEGAQRLAERINCVARSVKVIKPLRGKDARAWANQGATRASVDAVIANAYYWRPE